MGVTTLRNLAKKKVGLWRYCTEEWTRLSLHPADRKTRHQDRSELHPWGQEVQQITFNSQPMAALYRQKIRSAKSIEVLTDTMAGCALSVGTIVNRNHDDLEGVIAYAQGHLEGRIRRIWKEKTENDNNLFQHKMKRRWAEIWPMGFIAEPI